MDWNKFINFDQLIMPSVIKVIYVLGSIGVMIASIGVMSFGGKGILMAILVLLGGLLAVRLYCELIIVLFKISANISKIAGKTE